MGPPASSSSYLNIGTIIGVMKTTGAEVNIPNTSSELDL